MAIEFENGIPFCTTCRARNVLIEAIRTNANYCSVRKAASLSGYTTARIYSLIAEKKITAHKFPELGRAWRVDFSSLQSYIAEQSGKYAIAENPFAQGNVIEE